MIHSETLPLELFVGLESKAVALQLNLLIRNACFEDLIECRFQYFSLLTAHSAFQL